MNNKEEIKEDALYRMLMEVRRAPGPWLQSKSLKALDVFIGGFILGKSNAKKPVYNPEWYGEFGDYVLDVCLEEKGTHGIVSAIYENGYNDEEALNRYFQLLDEFLTEKYPDNEAEGASEDKHPTEGEIKAVEIGHEAICELADKYIYDNFNKIFDIEEEEGLSSTRIKMFFWSIDMMNLTIVEYDRKDYGYMSNLQSIIRDIDVKAESLLCDKPYTIINHKKESN